MTTKPDRPAFGRQTYRRWVVTLRDGTKLFTIALYRGMARHYSRSEREDYVSSGDHYRDVVSVRLAPPAEEDDCPF